MCRRCSGCRLVRMELVVAGWLLLGGWLLAPATAVRCYTDLMKTKVTNLISYTALAHQKQYSHLIL